MKLDGEKTSKERPKNSNPAYDVFHDVGWGYASLVTPGY